MTSSSNTRGEVNIEVSRITAEPGPAKTLRITATTMALDFSITFFGDPVIKVNGEAIRDSGTRSSKRDRRERARNSDSGQSFSTSEAESIPPSAQAHHALATPPGSKRPSLATSSSLPTSDPKRRCVGSPSPSTPVIITTTTVSSPACITDGSEDDLVVVNKKHCNPPTQDISKGLACHFHARDPTRYPGCGATKHDSIDSACEHIQENHLSPDYCAKCGKTFKSSAEQRKHVVAQTCELVSPLVVEGVHPDRIAALGKW